MSDGPTKFRVETEEGIQRFYDDSTLLALVIRTGQNKKGIHFFTPDEFSQQLAYMRHPASHVVLPHVHNPVSRSVVLTQEVLFIRAGRVRLDLYTENRHYLRSCFLHAGDIVLLAHGGHGLKVLEEAEIVEVKQGPYVGEADKTRFTPVEDSLVRMTAE